MGASLQPRATVATDARYKLATHTNAHDIVARRGGLAVGRADFFGDIAALAARLPAHRHVINMCADRYRFMVGLAASLQRGQISLLPPSDAPGVIETLAADEPDVYVLTDGPALALPTLHYPDDLRRIGRSQVGVALPAAQPAVRLFTSGSTGKPTPVQKSWGTLLRSAQAAGERLGIPRLAGATLVATVPHQHSYGLESLVLLALQFGLSVDSAWPLYPGDIRKALEATPRPRILVTSPVHIRSLVAEPGGMPLVDLIICATAPLSAALACQAEACFGATLIEIYGCTEAGQIATRRTALETQWHCLRGVELSQDELGCWASGPAVEGKALLQDAIELTGPGMFMLGDRAADLVNIAGKRTSLAYLNHQLLSIAGVLDGAFVLPEPAGKQVTRLAALAVAPGLRAEIILRALRENIDPAFLPRPVLLVQALPRNALGKLPRETLLRLIQQRQAP
jgi:acyl-coenzyme A synthetase/AMP-(fatty) acid ligase